MSNNLEVATDDFIGDLVSLINSHGLDAKFGVADHVLASSLVTSLEQSYKIVSERDRERALYAVLTSSDNGLQECVSPALDHNGDPL